MFDHLPGGPGDIWLRGHKRIAGRVAAWNSSWELQVLVSLREAGETNLKVYTSYMYIHHIFLCHYPFELLQFCTGLGRQ